MLCERIWCVKISLETCKEYCGGTTTERVAKEQWQSVPHMWMSFGYLHNVKLARRKDGRGADTTQAVLPKWGFKLGATRSLWLLVTRRQILPALE